MHHFRRGTLLDECLLPIAQDSTTHMSGKQLFVLHRANPREYLALSSGLHPV